MKKTLLLVTLSVVAICALVLTGFALSQTGDGSEGENLFSPDAFLQNYFKEDGSRPGTFSNRGVTTGTECFETKGLTDTYTFSGHVKIVDIGTQPWNGIRIVIGASAKGTDKLVVTKSMDTRLEFMGTNVNDATYSAVPLPLKAGTEFDYKVERNGRNVKFYINGALQAELTVDSALDTFDKNDSYNLGFEASDCHLEISDIVVICPDAKSQSGDSPASEDKLSNLFNPENNFTGVIKKASDGVYTNGERNTSAETFFCPYLTTDFTFGAHVRIVDIGSQPWDGVRLIFGSGDAGRDEFLLTKDWGTRLDFCNDNLNDAHYDREQLRLKAGTEFDFKIERKGAEVTLYLNGTPQCQLSIDGAHDAFDPDSAYNLGFSLSDCHFEAKDIYVYCLDAQKRLEAESSDDPSETSETPGENDSPQLRANTVTRLTATDALDRTTDDIVGFRDDKYVGLFYFTWFNSPVAGQKEVHNITEILREDADELFDINSRKYPLIEFYYFNEPLYGYYSSTDEYIIRRHLELFIAADVDFLALDFTNAIYYGEALQKMLDIYLEYQEAGWKVPQIMLFTNLQSGSIITRAYQQFYKSGKYDSLWFRADGDKPYVIGWEDQLGTVLQEYFTVRPPQWPNEPYMENGWPYVDLKKPQPVYADNLMSASVAQHSGDAFSFSIKGTFGQLHMSQGRGYTKKSHRNGNVEAILRGDNLQEEFDTAIKNDAKILFVTGWNEWIAQKLSESWSDVAFWVDTFNTEFSRDIEMTKSATYVPDGNGGYTEEGYGDNFYIQLVSNIRKFKGLTAVTERKDGNVTYLNIALTGYGRDSYGIIPSEDCHYTQAAPDNFIKSITVDHDGDSLLIDVLCDGEIKNLSFDDTLNILIGIKDSRRASWEHFQYKICSYRDGFAKLMTVTENGWSESDGNVRIACTVSGSHVSLTVPRDAIEAGGDFDMYFKVTDSIEKPLEILDYYVSGCSAPLGRLAYSYSVHGEAVDPAGTDDATETESVDPESTETGPAAPETVNTGDADTASPDTETGSGTDTDTAADETSTQQSNDGCASSWSSVSVMLAVMLAAAAAVTARRKRD